jgi:hypothetical protein
MVVCLFLILCCSWKQKLLCRCCDERTVNFVHFNTQSRGTAVAQSLRCCATNRKVAGSIPASVSGFFIDIKSFRCHCNPGVDSASNGNAYQEYFFGVKAAGTQG